MHINDRYRPYTFSGQSATITWTYNHFMHNKKPPKHHISHWRHTKRFGYGLIPVRSPLLRESLLVSFPPLTDMLKFSGYSRLIRVQVYEWNRIVQDSTTLFLSILFVSILCEIKAFKFPSIRYNKSSAHSSITNMYSRQQTGRNLSSRDQNSLSLIVFLITMWETQLWD
jgi:hypothetical protein